MNIKRASKIEAQINALPVFIAGYEKRYALRAKTEEKFRDSDKVARDKLSPKKPRLSSI